MVFASRTSLKKLEGADPKIEEAGLPWAESEANNSIAAADPICFGQASGFVKFADDFFSQSGVSGELTGLTRLVIGVTNLGYSDR